LILEFYYNGNRACKIWQKKINIYNIFMRIWQFFFYVFVFFVFWIFIIWNNFIFAQNNLNQNTIPEVNTDECLTCAMTPEILHRFIERNYDILSTIETLDRWERWWEYNSPRWLFNQWWLPSIPSPNQTWNSMSWFTSQYSILNSTFQGLRKNIKAKIQWFGTTASILSHNVFNRDFLIWFGIIFRQSPFVRDYKKLIELDNLISDKLFDTSMWWGLKDAIHPDHIKKINELTKKYEWWNMWVFEDWWLTIQSNATYKDLYSVLRAMNKKHRNVLAFPNISSKLHFGWEDIKSLSKSKILVKRAQNYAEILQESYTCVKWFVCDTSFSKFWYNMSKISENMKKWWYDSVKQIQSSVVRLQKSMQSFSEAIKYRSSQEQTLNSTICQSIYDNKLETNIWIKIWSNIDNEEWFVFFSLDIWKPKSWHKAYRQDESQDRQIEPSSENEAWTECNFKTWNMWTDEQSRNQIYDFLSRERELLNTQFGLEIYDANKDKSFFWRVFNVRWFPKFERKPKSQEALSQESSIPSETQDLLDNMSQWQQRDLEQKRKIMDEIMNYNYWIDWEKYEKLVKLEDSIEFAIQDTIQNHDLDISQSIYSNSDQTTKAIASMVQKVRFATDMIWNKQNSNSLINNLWKACEWQCANAWWVCYAE